MTTLNKLAALALLAACGGSDAPPPEAAPAPAPPALTLADFAGTWENSATLTGVADPVASTITGTADPATWTMSLEGRPNIPMTVAVVGDSLIATSAEYESVLRTGVMVTTRTASVLQDGMLIGNLVATYKTPAGEEQVSGTLHGMRKAQ
jgi:hypothetical protein